MTYIFSITQKTTIFPLWFINQTLGPQYLLLFQCFFQQIPISNCPWLFFCLKRKVSIFYTWWKFDERQLLDLLLYRFCGPAAWRNCRVNQYQGSNVRGDFLPKSGAKFVRLQFLFFVLLLDLFHSRQTCCHSCCCLYAILAFFCQVAILQFGQKHN